MRAYTIPGSAVCQKSVPGKLRKGDQESCVALVACDRGWCQSLKCCLILITLLNYSVKTARSDERDSGVTRK